MALPTKTRSWHLPKPNPEGHKTLQLTEDDVEALKPTEVLVKVHATSINYTDLSIAKGTDGTNPFPGCIPLSDMAGEVIAVGSSVRFLKVGDRVAASRVWDHVHGNFEAYMFYTISGHRCNGMLTEYKVMPEHGLVVVPDHLSWEEAACLPCSGVTAWSCLFGPKPIQGGDYIVVQGTGGVAMFVVQFAAACGANVIVTSSSDEKLKIAQSHGAQYLINYKTTPDWDEEVKKITGGAGAEHIIEIGGPGTLQKSVNCVAYGGYIHAVGFVASGTGENINITRLAMTKAFSLRGVFVGPATSFKAMNRLISARQLKPVVAKVFPYEETIAAYDYMTNQNHVGKVVIRVSKD